MLFRSALDGTEGQFRSHIRIARNAGVTETQIWSIVDLLQEQVGRKEAYRANNVMSGVYERRFAMGYPIEDVFPKGRISATDYFSGTVWNQRLVSSDSTTHCQISNVTFEAGAHTRWHQHTGTQILLCTAGSGWYQQQGESALRLHTGSVVVIKPGVKHWHGASVDSEFSHLSVIPNPESNRDIWLEAVSDEEYNQLTL